jgi:hypothetical protein
VATGFTGQADRPSIPRTKRYMLPRDSQARKHWPWLREKLDEIYGSSPRPAPDTDPHGAAAEDKDRPPKAGQVLAWGTPRNVRHRSVREGRTIDARPFAASPWADSDGVKEELLKLGERMHALYVGRRDLQYRVGDEDEVRRIRARKETRRVSALRDYGRGRWEGKFHIFYTNPGMHGYTSDALAQHILRALGRLPGKWPWEPVPEPDRKPDPDRVSIPLDPERVATAKAFLIRRRHRVESRTPLRFTVEARENATDEEWDSDWLTYKSILLDHSEDRAPPVLAAA